MSYHIQSQFRMFGRTILALAFLLAAFSGTSDAAPRRRLMEDMPFDEPQIEIFLLEGEGCNCPCHDEYMQGFEEGNEGEYDFSMPDEEGSEGGEAAEIQVEEPEEIIPEKEEPEMGDRDGDEDMNSRRMLQE